LERKRRRKDSSRTIVPLVVVLSYYYSTVGFLLNFVQITPIRQFYIGISTSLQANCVTRKRHPPCFVFQVRSCIAASVCPVASCLATTGRDLVAYTCLAFCAAAALSAINCNIHNLVPLRPVQYRSGAEIQFVACIQHDIKQLVRDPFVDLPTPPAQPYTQLGSYKNTDKRNAATQRNTTRTRLKQMLSTHKVKEEEGEARSIQGHLPRNSHFRSQQHCRIH
jgi:hypothetical protein